MNTDATVRTDEVSVGSKCSMTDVLEQRGNTGRDRYLERKSSV